MKNTIGKCSGVACGCPVFVCGKYWALPTAPGSACGRCGHTFHEHLSAPSGAPPATIPNPHPVSPGTGVGCYFAGCWRGSRNDAFDVGTASNAPPAHDAIPCTACNHAVKSHMGFGPLAAGEGKEDLYLDPKEVPTMQATLQHLMEEVKDMPPVDRAFQRFVKHPTGDNHVICTLMALLATFYKDNIVPETAADDVVDTAQREDTLRQGLHELNSMPAGVNATFQPFR
eukprot:TRINITY_DN63365_c0_g1_i2.p1 TRINITY_DN63365_c0_g1~~TRINITY_DN63365_c0_g1_i2.p1  ORF type:complete len:259 (-),score=13.12 TRINITY_DN63365_c0_g1_i2:55-738(-)